jgi:N-acetylneuraminic acid mutarotase/regulation of enolase protein 1 (concanavalin A-like superfamily)
MMSAVAALPPAGSVKLTGTLIGTPGSYENKGNTIAEAMDGNTNTFFDAPVGVQGWVGLDLGAPAAITQVQYVPRSGFDSRMVGGIFQASSTPDFSANVVTLYTVTNSPPNGVYTAEQVNVAEAYEFVRYLSPIGGSGNIAELEFDGVSTSTPITPAPPVIPPPPPTAPPAPVGLSATAVSASNIQLSWQEAPSSIVTSFSIERQGRTDPGLVIIGTVSGSTTNFDDSNALAATSYTYEVVASNLGGTSVSSAAASATTLAAPADPWADLDIGAVGFAGSAMVNSNGSITVSGSGADIWNTTDAFNFDSQPMIGDGTVIAQVTSQTNSSSWAKSGIMMRETRNDDSRYVLLALTPGNGVTLQARTATHVTPTISLTVPGKAGVWLEMVRNGSSFSGYVSIDGIHWTLVGAVAIPMVNNIQVGLAVTAHNNTRTCTAAFSDVTITSSGTQASSWSAGTAGPMPRWESESFSYNNELYVFGGFIDRNLDSTAECDVYDPVTNMWSYVTTMPSAITHAAVTLVGDTVYLAGGNIGSFGSSQSGVATGQVLTYDLTTGIWGSIASLPQPVTSGGMVCINNQLIYYGGINAANSADLSNTWSLDLTNPDATWTAEATMPNARNHIGYVAIDGIAYAVGGTHLYKETTGNDSEVDAYNPVSNTWSQVAALPMPWGGIHVSTLVVNGNLVVIGGQTNGGYDGIYLNDIEEYSPATNTWAAVGILPEANQGQAVAYIDDELVVVDGTVDNQGGWAQNQTLLDNEIQL